MCDFEASEKTKLKRHYLIHTGERPFQCPHCPKRFRSKFNMERHVFTHTGEKPFICDVCEMSFNQKGWLDRHVNEVHLGIFGHFPCEICPRKSFRRKSDLQQHCTRFHVFNPKKCSRCPIICNDWYTMKTHKKVHRSGLRSWSCPHCDFKTKSKKAFRKHCQIHKSTPLKNKSKKVPKPRKKRTYFCKICGRSYKMRMSYEKHAKLHDEDIVPTKRIETSISFDRTALHSCNICQATFRSLRIAKNHFELLHQADLLSDENYHPCSNCELSFKTKKSLKEHQKVHNQVSKHATQDPIGIESNNNTLIDQDIFEKNVANVFENMEEDPLMIDDATCKNTHELRQHMKSHSKNSEETCQICLRVFKNSSGLNRHMKTHQEKLMPAKNENISEEKEVDEQNICPIENYIIPNEGMEINEDNHEVQEELVEDQKLDLSMFNASIYNRINLDMTYGKFEEKSFDITDI